MVCTAVGSTPSTFDSPASKAAASPVRAEKTGADGLPASADDEQPTHNPEPDAAARESCIIICLS